MKLETLRDLYIHELKDLYSAEKQLVKALPKVAKAATHPDLKAGVLTHLEETKEHVNRLEKILADLGTSPRGPKCKGMEGLIAEGDGLIEDEPDEEVLDAGLICGAQRIEHYEIAGYGCARAFAELLGEEEAMELLKMTLEEERATDEKLTKLAVSAINVAAVEDDGEDTGPQRKTASSGNTKNSKGKPVAKGK
jgi:ferritin-like metal-binding protein YciE